MPDSFRIPADELHATIQQLAREIASRHARTKGLVLLGIANGGIEAANRLNQALNKEGLSPAIGTIDVSFHRDDIGISPIPKEFNPTLIPIDVDGATVILVDDVLFTGRTIKAALDELFDHGRPAKVELAVFVDRGQRLLPVGADYAGYVIDVPASEKVVVRLDPKKPANDCVETIRSKS